MKPNEVTPAEAAKMLGVGRLYLYELLASGRIKGRKLLGRWLLSTSSVEAYRRGSFAQRDLGQSTRKRARSDTPKRAVADAAVHK
jgi:excisionase family DNA binding protein